MTNTTAPEALTAARKLADILRAHDHIAHADATSGAHFDGWIRYNHIAEYVDITEEDIRRLIDDAMENMTSPTHKVTDLRRDAFIAERVS